MRQCLAIDGSHGEGGGQILRTALTFAALHGRPIHIANIRAARRRPGLAAQHITCVRAAGALCDARIRGDSLGSRTLDFEPRAPVRAGHYAFDVASARAGGSAGSTTLVLQTVFLPLALADGVSTLRIVGGTHMRWSPSYHFLRDAWLPCLRRTGLDAELALDAWGWFPVGRGVIRAAINGSSGRRPRALHLLDRGVLMGVRGCAVAANLPEHIPRRMADRAAELLRGLSVPLDIEALSVRAACAGAGIFLTAQYAETECAVGALGVRGKPAEDVAAAAVGRLLAHHAGPGALEAHLGDQVLVVLALADGTSRFSVPRSTGHLATNAWLIEHFGLAQVNLEEPGSDGCRVTVTPHSGTGPCGSG